ncbi:hypothetical protein M422DRAFT_272380 [Sphaerobolus stellatus SS14]|uniref:DUF6533 domain-containing protein n=1 Tax=Sphaerobolus stellatus (strain SS14) TaxID=990650 RepID=A0A0C9UBS2_SPHS4|nr:hypothetical protein M422DRAFT_272380 [Sphaerobolus stellatus SS14]
MSQALPVAFIVEEIIHVQVNTYYTAIMTTLLLYTYVLTFDVSAREECLLVWKQRKTFSNFLFVGFRYFPILAFIADQIRFYAPYNGQDGIEISPGIVITINGICGLWWPRLIAGPVISVCTGLILILRVQALYARANWVLGILIPAYLCQLAIIGWSMWKDVTRPAIKLDGNLISTLCIFVTEIGTGSSSLAPVFIAAIVFDIMIFCLTFWKGRRTRLHKTIIPLLQVILRDGNLYFLAIFIVNLITLLAILVVPFSPYLGISNVQMSAIVTGILVTRLFFNLKHVALKSRNNPLSLVLPNRTAMRKRATLLSTSPCKNGFIRNEYKPEQTSQATGRFGMTTLRTMVDLDLSDLGVDLQDTKDDFVPSLLEEETETYGEFAYYEMRDISYGRLHGDLG